MALRDASHASARNNGYDAVLVDSVENEIVPSRPTKCVCKLEYVIMANIYYKEYL
jgi:hypothetical protein